MKKFSPKSIEFTLKKWRQTLQRKQKITAKKELTERSNNKEKTGWEAPNYDGSRNLIILMNFLTNVYECLWMWIRFSFLIFRRPISGMPQGTSFRVEHSNRIRLTTSFWTIDLWVETVFCGFTLHLPYCSGIHLFCYLDCETPRYIFRIFSLFVNHSPMVNEDPSPAQKGIVMRV